MGTRDVVGVLAQDLRSRVPDSRSSSLGPQVQDRRRCRASPCRIGLDRVLAFAVLSHLHALFRGQPGAARQQRHAVGDDEGRIEADAELPDQLRVLRAVDVSRWKNSRVPDLAIVPIWSMTSCRDMPMPLSDTVIVRAAAS